MLVLGRRRGERVLIGGEIEVTVLEVRGNRVKLGVSGPSSIAICREELLRARRVGAIAEGGAPGAP